MIEKLHSEVQALEARLADADLYSRDPQAFQQTSDSLTAARTKLEQAEERWLELEEKREALAAGGPA